MTHQLKITIEGPQGSGKTMVAHLLWGTLRALGCKVEVRDGDDQNAVQFIDKTASATVHRLRPSVLLKTQQDGA